MSNTEPQKLTRSATLSLLLWGVGLLAGGLAITAYSSIPGTELQSVSMWPSDSAIPRSGSRPTIVLFLHPKCPCSIATLREFERAQKPNNRVEVRIVYYCPPHEDDTWCQTNLLELGQRISAGSTFIDRSAIEAKRFGAVTSGHLFAFSAAGECLFSGGITNSRGHEGSNSGVVAIRQLFQEQPFPYFERPVYGCPIFVSTPPGADEKERLTCNHK